MATHSANSSRAGSPTPSLGSDSPSRASGSRRSVSASASSKGPFYRADTSFNPSPRRKRTLPLYRSSGIPPAAPAMFDTPQATIPPFDGSFVRPPFDDLPDSVVLVNEGMNYSVMHKHPTWFLDIHDFVTLDASRDGAIRYPRDLEPPRPRRQKDLLLRCTFCPRTYAGVNAKSMWTRHVREKHRVVLSKAWSDTATSSRRQSTGKTVAIAGVPLLPTDETSPVRQPESSGNSPLTTVPLAVTKPVPVAVPKSKPGPKPKPKPAKPASPVKAKKVGVTRKIVIPAQKPKPKPAPPPAFVMPWVRSLSPPPPEGIRPPRMRPFPRKSLIAIEGSIEFKAPETPAYNASRPFTPRPSAESEQTLPAMVAQATPDGGLDFSEFDSIASTPPAERIVDRVVATAPSTPSNGAVPRSQTDDPAADPPPDKSLEDEDNIQADKEIEDLLLMDVDMLMDEPDEDVDMELEDEEELNPPIALGGLAEPMFGVENDRADLFLLSSRHLIAAMSPAFSPATEVSREPSVEGGRAATPQPTEPPEEEETPPLGRFKVSSLAYLMDKNLSVSPPPSPVPSHRSLTPTPTEMINGRHQPPTATVFAPMQDVFVLKTRKMDPALKAKFLGHLQEQFGVEVREDPVLHGAGVDSGPWAALPERIVGQIMSEHARASEDDDGMAVDALGGGGGEFAALTNAFRRDSAAELRVELDEQRKMFIEAFAEELTGPLQEALTLQLKDEIIVQVADQMMDALVVQGEEAHVEFEWRRRVLERQLWDDAAADEGESRDVQEDVIQHPLHHLFLAKATPADLDVRASTSLSC